MIKSLLWFALGLVALGCAESLGPQQPVTNEDPMFKHYMCREGRPYGESWRVGHPDREGTAPGPRIRVSQVIVHEHYKKEGALNDVALLILERPVNMSLPNVGTICLPGKNMDKRNCVATGWGKDKFGKEGKYQETLKKVNLPMVPRSRCQEELRKTKLGHDFRLHESFVCAGGIRGIDTCQGDGGGPLVCPSKDNPDVYMQAGIVSWGINCNTETPGVYVDVSHFVDWIYDSLQVERINPRG